MIRVWRNSFRRVAGMIKGYNSKLNCHQFKQFTAVHLYNDPALQNLNLSRTFSFWIYQKLSISNNLFLNLLLNLLSNYIIIPMGEN